MNELVPRQGQVLSGAIFHEPVRVVTVEECGPGRWRVGVVGLGSQAFRNVILGAEEMRTLAITEGGLSFAGNAKRLRLGLQAYALGIAHEFDPFFALSISRVEPLPHQLEAVYDYLLKLPRIRFLLADDAGAGKTIMAGLLIKELSLRGLAERILIVCPANLAFQWQRELNEKFGEKFVVLRGGEIREQFGVNQWLENRRVITSLDLAKRADILPGLRQVRWDLVIVDEAHRMSAADESHKSLRYRLGELLRDTTDHLLLLTATPHKGDPQNFCLFLQLLDADAYADVQSIREAMNQRRAPFYLRRTKEAMIYFPERQPDGSWAARPIFTKRIPHTVEFSIEGPELGLYMEVTRFVKRESARAAEREEDPRARAIGFLMSLFQRRLASSAYALRRSLESRARRLAEGLRRAEELAALAPTELPGEEELEEMEEAERERLERLIEAVTLADSAEEIEGEVEELKRLAALARAVEENAAEAKLAKLRSLLKSEGFFDRPDQRLLIFTEFRDTLDYLVDRLRKWGFHVGFIHGGMKPGSREEPGTRLFAEQKFREGAIQILVATEAAGEGINLQVCNVLFNYDIPWNPNRLEQRMGRIHRFGQRKDCLIFNFVAENTIEGKVLKCLHEKLREIRDALNDDSVFNVVGEVLPAARLERVLRDYYAGRLGDADLEDRLLRDVDERRFRAICQHALEGLASRKLNLAMLLERRARAQERRVVPETIARFLREAAALVRCWTLRPLPQLPYAFEPDRTPSELRQYEREPDWRLPALAEHYPPCSTDRDAAEKHGLEWITPGHPLFEALRRHTLRMAERDFVSGATFHSFLHEEPVRIDFYRARVVDGLGHVVGERLFVLELRENAEPRCIDPGALGNFSPAEAPATLPPVADAPEAIDWLHRHVLDPFLGEVRADRLAEIERIAEHVELSLTELIHRADQEVGKAAIEIEERVPGAEGRKAQADARHKELCDRRQRRRAEFERQRAMTLQDVERIASVLVLPHPEREAPEVRSLQPDLGTEAVAMRVVIAHERSLGRQVCDVSDQNLGYDLTSLDPVSGELRLIEVKGIGGSAGNVLLTPNERRVAEDRRDCYWLYIVTNCDTDPVLQEPVRDPVRLPWNEVTKVAHYRLSVDAMTKPMQVREDPRPYGGQT